MLEMGGEEGERTGKELFDVAGAVKLTWEAFSELQRIVVGQWGRFRGGRGAANQGVVSGWGQELQSFSTGLSE